MKLDMTKDPNEVYPSTTLARVQVVEEKQSGGGLPMLNLTLVHDHGRALLLYDNIMLDGPGWGIGYSKLIALGVDPKHTGEFDPQSLHDRRVWVATKAGEYKGKKRLEVDIDKLANNGYQAWDNAPEGCEEAGEDVASTPFG